MDLRPYQHQAIDHLLDHPRAAAWLSMGMGKTRSVLVALDTLYLTGELTGPTLIVAPKRVCESVWRQEAIKWGLDHLAPVSILGTPKVRERALKEKAHSYMVNFENLPWLTGKLRTWPFMAVVVDESSRLRGYRLHQGAKQAGALGKVVHQSQRHIQLSGTPAPNGLEGLWGQAWFLDQGDRLGKTYTAFIRRWFRQINCGGHFIKIEPLPHAADEIHKRLSDLCLSIDPRPYFGTREPITVQIPVTLPPDALGLYKRMERDFFAEIGRHEVDAKTAATKSMKLLQMASGAVIHDTATRDWVKVHDAKLDALESLVEESAGVPLIVAYHFKSDLARIKARFAQAVELDDQAVDDWNAGKIPLLLLHPQSAGHGLNLAQGGNILVFYTNTWNLEHRLQTVERIGPVRQAQAGLDRPVYVYDLAATGTLDEVMPERHQSKRAVQDLLLARMQR